MKVYRRVKLKIDDLFFFFFFSHQVFRQNDEVFRQIEGKLKLVEGQVNMVEGQGEYGPKHFIHPCRDIMSSQKSVWG